MQFNYRSMPQWPPLAWLAECTPGSDTINVYHGERIETTDQWFIAGAWAGKFSEGGFDATDIVAGSGARIRGEKVWFVSSGSNVDRLHSFQKNGGAILSNSLCCLLSWVDGSPDIGYLSYAKDFSDYRYTVFGVHSLSFPSSAGPVKLTYFANLLWNFEQLEEHDKPCRERRLGSFDDYVTFLKDSLSLVAENAAHSGRLNPFKLLCSVSNGYDSPTVAAIAKSVCDVEAFTVEKDRDGRDDSGAAIAAKLDIPCHVVDRDLWREAQLAEVPFIACSGSVGDMVFKSAEKLLKGKILLLGGPGGDTSWNKNARISEPMAVGGGALLGLTEFSIWAGFVSCPVPMWGIRQIRDIIHISNSAEMGPWDTGGKYTRPICRRILEDAGVPRSYFGIGKRGVSFVPHSIGQSLSESSKGDFMAWFDRLFEGSSDGRRPGGSPELARIVDTTVPILEKLIGVFIPLLDRRGLWQVRKFFTSVQKRLNEPYYHYKYLIHWAVDRAKQRYSSKENFRLGH